MGGFLGGLKQKGFSTDVIINVSIGPEFSVVMWHGKLKKKVFIVVIKYKHRALYF